VRTCCSEGLATNVDGHVGLLPIGILGAAGQEVPHNEVIQSPLLCRAAAQRGSGSARHGQHFGPCCKDTWLPVCRQLEYHTGCLPMQACANDCMLIHHKPMHCNHMLHAEWGRLGLALPFKHLRAVCSRNSAHHAAGWSLHAGALQMRAVCSRKSPRHASGWSLHAGALQGARQSSVCLHVRWRAQSCAVPLTRAPVCLSCAVSCGVDGGMRLVVMTSCPGWLPHATIQYGRRMCTPPCIIRMLLHNRL
jgi:hypothetical protein